MSTINLYVASEMNDFVDIISFGLFTKLRKRIAYHQSAGLQLDGENEDKCQNAANLYKKTIHAGALITRKASPDEKSTRRTSDHSQRLANERACCSLSVKKKSSSPTRNMKRCASSSESSLSQPLKRSHSLKMKNMVKKMGGLRRSHTLNNISEERYSKAVPKMSLSYDTTREESDDDDNNDFRCNFTANSPRPYRPTSYPVGNGYRNMLEPPVIRTTSGASQCSSVSTSTDANTLNFKLVYDTNLMPGMPSEKPRVPFR